VVQPRPAGLCDAIFRARPLIGEGEQVIVGLPDTIWFRKMGWGALPDDALSFLLFPVDQPEFFDSVITDAGDYVREIQVKTPRPDSSWVWGAFKMPGAIFHHLFDLWLQRDRQDEYVGTLVNAFLAAGGRARGIRAGRAYVDVGTLHGYREAIRLLSSRSAPGGPGRAALTQATDPEEPAAAGPSGSSRATKGAVVSGALAHPDPNSSTPGGERHRATIAEFRAFRNHDTNTIQERVRALGAWFHNLNLRGVQTAPDHFLGDYPSNKWRSFAHCDSF